ncbi:S8 family serine peptidase [bacterium]|nr:S8 family serine peptidase [bacterium]
MNTHRNLAPGRLGALAALALTLAVSPAAMAQDAADVRAVDPELKKLPLTSLLDRFGRDVIAGKTATGGPTFVAAAERRGLRARPDGLVNVEIVGQVGSVPVDPGLVRRFGGEIDAVWRHQTSAWLPPSRTRDLARVLPPGYLLRDASLPHENDEGPGVTGSDTYLAGGADGSGIAVGILDRNYQNFTQAQAVSPPVVPQNPTAYDYTGNGTFGGSSPHGTAQVECVYDHAPGADYHIFRIANSTHLGLAIDDAIDAGVQILSATQSWYNQGWADGSGTANAAIDEAGDAGILYFNSAGNRAETHWQGTFRTTDADDWHEWDASGDEVNSFSIGNNATMFIYLQWDTGAGVADYDLYLVDASTDSLLDFSISGGETFETIVWTNDTGSSLTGGLMVDRWSGAAVEFEVFNHYGRVWEHRDPESSVTPPTNNLHPNTLSIGAVDEGDYAANQADPITAYSSQGPSNEGRYVLDLAAPTNTTTWAYGGGFGGTSAATPNAAGVAAALWSSQPQLSAEGIRHLLLRQAELVLDWGPGGIDHIYGRGGVNLHRHAPATEWLDAQSNNAAGSPMLPWSELADAYAATADGGRILMLGGGYDGPFTLDRTLTVESVTDATVGAN